MSKKKFKHYWTRPTYLTLMKNKRHARAWKSKPIPRFKKKKKQKDKKK